MRGAALAALVALSSVALGPVALGPVALGPLALAQASLPDVPAVTASGRAGSWEWVSLSEPFTGASNRLAFTRSTAGAGGVVLALRCIDEDFWAWQLLFGTVVGDDPASDPTLIFDFGGRRLELTAASGEGGAAAVVADPGPRDALLEAVRAGGTAELTVVAASGRLEARFELDGARVALAAIGCPVLPGGR